MNIECIYNELKSRLNNINLNFKNNTIFFKKYENITVLTIESDFYYLYLDNRILKHIVKLYSILKKMDIEFYCVIPSYSNPSGIYDFYNSNIKHYILMYLELSSTNYIEKYNIDIIDNMISWCLKFECLDLIANNYNLIKSDIVLNRYLRFSIRDYSHRIYIDDKIKKNYESLYREITIKSVLN